MAEAPDHLGRRQTTRRAVLASGLGGLAGMLAGCSGPRVAVVPDDDGSKSRPGFPGQPAAVSYPHLRPDGNRFVPGTGALPDVDPVDVRLDEIDAPIWVLGLPMDEGSRWVAVDDSGRAAALRVSDGGIRPATVEPASLPPGTPPVLGTVDGRLRLWVPPDDAAPHAIPAVLDAGRTAFVDTAGRLVVTGPRGTVGRLDVDVLPDVRILSAGDGRVALLAGATDRYDHGVLGDAIEAARIITATVGDGSVAIDRSLAVDPPAVIEGTAPIWADLTGSGRRDLVVTASQDRSGARILAFVDGTAETLAGPPIGTGHRWRHQLAVAPFAPDGVPELAVVRTPHIGGRVEFYRATDDGLEIQATAEGVSTHVIGSRNLDGGFAADVDADGRLELLVPTQERDRLVAVRRTGTGAIRAWDVPIGGRLASNLAAVPRPDGWLTVAVGRDDGVVRVWPAGD